MKEEEARRQHRDVPLPERGFDAGPVDEALRILGCALKANLVGLGTLLRRPAQRLRRRARVFRAALLKWHRLLFGIRFELIHFEALCLLDQQGAIPLHLLAKALSIPLSKARRVVNTCIKLGLVQERRILVRDRHPWLWLSREGASALGSRRHHLGAPRLARLRHYLIAARIRVRLTAKAEPETLRKRLWEWWRPAAIEFVAWLADKTGYEISLKPQRGNMIAGMRWVSTREHLDRSMHTRGQDLPDALIELDGRKIGIVIALYPWSSSKVIADFEELRASCDEICCFCAPRVRRSVEEALDEVEEVRVHVFDIPQRG